MKKMSLGHLYFSESLYLMGGVMGGPILFFTSFVIGITIQL